MRADRKSTTRIDGGGNAAHNERAVVSQSASRWAGRVNNGVEHLTFCGRRRWLDQIRPALELFLARSQRRFKYVGCDGPFLHAEGSSVCFGVQCWACHRS